jgi:hypothetical protein
MADTHLVPLTEGQLRDLLAGKGPGLNSFQVDTINNALQSGNYPTAQELGLNWHKPS